MTLIKQNDLYSVPKYYTTAMLTISKGSQRQNIFVYHLVVQTVYRDKATHSYEKGVLHKVRQTVTAASVLLGRVSML